MAPLENQDFSEKYRTVPQSEWKSHWLLSRLLSGSDLDGDWAVFWVAQIDVATDDLQRIIFQRREEGGDWKDCPSVEDSYLLGSQLWGVAGAYTSLSLNGKKRELRALVPADLSTER